MKKKTKIKNCVAYGKICNKFDTKDVLSLIIPDDCIPLDRDDIKVETIPSKRALQERGLLQKEIAMKEIRNGNN